MAESIASSRIDSVFFYSHRHAVRPCPRSLLRFPGLLRNSAIFFHSGQVTFGAPPIRRYFASISSGATSNSCPHFRQRNDISSGRPVPPPDLRKRHAVPPNAKRMIRTSTMISKCDCSIAPQRRAEAASDPRLGYSSFRIVSPPWRQRGDPPDEDWRPVSLNPNGT